MIFNRVITCCNVSCDDGVTKIDKRYVNKKKGKNKGKDIAWVEWWWWYTLLKGWFLIGLSWGVMYIEWCDDGERDMTFSRNFSGEERQIKNEGPMYYFCVSSKGKM
jgi:hypothetical protein